MHKEYKKTCAVCGDQFTARRSSTKVCSAQCRHKQYQKSNPDISRGIASIGEKCDEITDKTVSKAMFILAERNAKSMDGDIIFYQNDIQKIAESIILGFKKIENILKEHYIKGVN